MKMEELLGKRKDLFVKGMLNNKVYILKKLLHLFPNLKP